MDFQCSKSGSKPEQAILARYLREFLIPRAHSVILFGALFCTLGVKLYHSKRNDLTNEYVGWILSDVSFFLVIEAVLSLACFRWPKKWLMRTAMITAAVICTWSVMNAGWLIRTGTQILPRVLLPLFRDPVSAFYMIGVNLVKMPLMAAILLVPSAAALAFFFFALARPSLPSYDRRRFLLRVLICFALVLVSIAARPALARRGSPQITAVGLHDNSQLRALMSLVLPDYRTVVDPKRHIPSHDQVVMTARTSRMKPNVVLVILEGVQYQYTSLSDETCHLTPYLESLASQGVEFTNARSSLTHTTKALFALLTGRFASASQDIAETVPAKKPYASLATELNDALNYRTAFFQSAAGSFESRPGLVCNLGFDKFWARDDLNDPNSHLGYLGCDEFTMLEPIKEWIQADERPFLLVVLCSVTHDPYEVPEWFGGVPEELLDRYRQAIFYTDKFLAALDVEMTQLNIAQETIFCVVGDHGEAFGEHGLLGHERIAFDEALRIPFCIRAPFLVEAGRKESRLVSSIDLTPTLLSLLGFKTESAGFDGVNVLAPGSGERRVYFSGWMQEGPAGFVEGHRKFIHNPVSKTISVYDLEKDPLERVGIELPTEQIMKAAEEIASWRKGTIIRINQERTGKKMLYDSWLCGWTNRISYSKYIKESHK
ncbi:MAG: LTA synthase family protein [Sedimentisphaerales bacterium]|nr:LTA synthase family protein [Sedimentisphaerales bacterium]